ncbi:DsrE family protein [Methyloversatilis universalis]|uniref:DsrE family protein n=1 Tax=Methyloversatilis universalis TaxID=378211 RepID=UPI00037866B6|nr:DsrE family protein [Methyloversatilis universalis]
MTPASLLRHLFGLTGAFFTSLALAGGTVVYHINDAAAARGLLGNVQNHLNASPDIRIHVVSNGRGVDFLLRDALDAEGKAYAPAVQALASRGVAFKVCRNTLKARSLTDEAVLTEASVVPAGVAEVARLQLDEKAAYIKP